MFKHKNEKASAGYYSVLLDDDAIQTEFTATERVGFHHYHFSSTAQNNIILDLQHRDEVIESSINIEDSVTISGLRRSKAWADNQYVFFVIKFSKPIVKKGIWQDDKLSENLASSSSKNIKAYFQFDLSSSKDIYVKVALSPVSVEGARKNMEKELPGWDFEMAKSNATKKWETELAKIEVKSTGEDKLRIFYTALYHTAIAPNINMDVDGQYRGRDDKIHAADGFTYYSVFSLWDTYRAAHPLYTIIDRERTLDYIKTFLAQYQQGGRLPVWELASCETNCMIGYHSVPVITDAYAKGINGFDTKLALEAMQKSATFEHWGLPDYIKKGMIETDDDNENVSKTLEYSYDDWCIAMFAKMTGNQMVHEQYIKRAQYYKNMLDIRTGFMRPRKNGGWLKPFDPREVNNNFTEANSWQYSFYMPQDIGGYLQLIGGPMKLEQKLDSLFATSSQMSGRDQSDISGLIGQYAHGNEPSHHIIYLYDYTGKAYKTQRLVHKVMTEMYKNDPDGLIGNEDCGQMSAWYVLSALGFYPVTPGTTNYMIGTPAFNFAEIHLENGKSFIIDATGLSDKNFYIQSSSLGTTAASAPMKWELPYLQHSDIANGGRVSFAMGEKPLTSYSKKMELTFIGSNKTDPRIVLNPIIDGGAVPFKNSKIVSINSPQKNVTVYYSLDGSDPTEKSLKYLNPILINKSATLKAIAINQQGIKSFVTTASYKKVSHNWTIKYNTPYEQQYDGGGPDGLIDEIRGTPNWRQGSSWLGYQKNDMDVVVDLKAITTVSKIMVDFLQDSRAWIIMPKQIVMEYSTDGKKFTQFYKVEDVLNIQDMQVQIMEIDPSFVPVQARYIRVKAVQYGKLPEGHDGAGGDSHIFVSEIAIE
jgi:predicted alpha-1,2-mannosidase